MVCVSKIELNLTHFYIILNVLLASLEISNRAESETMLKSRKNVLFGDVMGKIFIQDLSTQYMAT